MYLKFYKHPQKIIILIINDDHETRTQECVNLSSDSFKGIIRCMILYFRISNFHWSRLLHAASRDLSSHVSVCDKKNLFVRGPIFVMLFSKLV